MRKLLLSSVFALSLSAMGQTAITSVMDTGTQTIPQAAHTPKVEAGQGQLWWANYDLDSNWSITGTSITEHYEVAVHIPAGLVGSAEGTTIDGLSFVPIASHIANVKAWVADALSESGDVLEEVSIDASELNLREMNDTKFSQAHLIPAEGLYVGISFDVTALADVYDINPMVYTNTSENRDKAFFYRTTTEKKWREKEGNAVIKVLFGGGKFPKYSARAYDFGPGHVAKDDVVKFPVVIRSMGTDSIKNISFTVTTDNVTTDEMTIEAMIYGFQKSATIHLPFASDEETGAHQKTLTITKVNGEPNEWTGNSASGSIITLSHNPKVLPVVEALVSANSGASPAGIVGMQWARQQYGDSLLILAIHNDDAMQTYDYRSFILNFSAYPDAWLNRQYSFYPSVFFFPSNVERGFARVSPASITASAQWISTDSIAITTTTTFAYDNSDAKYGIALVLVADSLTGTGQGWIQKNGYSGDSGDKNMQFWYDAPSEVTGIVYNDVPVAAWDISLGADGSVPSTVRDGEELEYSRRVGIAGNKIIQHKHLLYVVALLIDRTSYQIANAARAYIQAPEWQGIESIAASDNGVVMPAVRYDIAGRRISTQQKGFYILRTADGKTVKAIGNSR